MSTAQVKALERKIRRMLQKSYDWLEWNSALETAFAEISGGDREVFYCVDTSEVVDYLLPNSLKRPINPYPTSLDLSLLIIFKSGRRLFILPPHLRELKGLSNLWSERLRAVAQQLNLLKEGIESWQVELDRLHSGDQGERALDQFVDVVLRQRRLFSQVFGLATQRGKSLETLLHRLELPDPRCLGLEGWRYEPDPDQIDFWYEQLSHSKVASGGPPTHLIDAHALHMLELINKALPENRFLFLSTQSGKIWEVIEKLRDENGEVLMKKGVSLVQRPQLALVKTLLKQEGPEVKVRRERLIVEKERSGSLREMRQRLEKEILPFLEEGDLSKLDLAQVEQLVQDLNVGIDRLDSVSQDKQWIERLRLALDPAVEPAEGLLQQFLGALQGNRREAMREVLSRRLGGLIKEAEDLQQKLSLAAATTPSPSMMFESLGDQEPSFGIRGILSSQPGGQAYSLRFQSQTILEHLLRIQGLFEGLDLARQDPERKKQQGYELQQEMYRCEVELRGEPEYYLLLALVFSSRQMWFQSFDAADQGLKKIWHREGLVESPTPEQATASATTELLLAQSSALTNWTLEHYADLPVVSARFLARAAGLARRSLQLQQRWAAALPHSKALDPRCLRELSKIYGTAREESIPLPVDPEDRELAGLPAAPPPDPLDVYLSLARAAYERGRDDAKMRIYYENSLLYALVEKDSREHLEERKVLAEAFAGREGLERDPNFLDTLAWHYFRLALRLQREGRPYREDLATAHRRIESAHAQISKSNGFYSRLIQRHRDEILQAVQESG